MRWRVLYGTMAALVGLATAAYRILTREGLAQERTRAAFEERLREAHKHEGVARLAGVVAREVTPPLDVLTAITDQLLDALAIGDLLREQARRASDQVLRLTEFTRSLSVVSGRRRGRVSRIDVADAIAEAMPAVKRTASESCR